MGWLHRDGSIQPAGNQINSQPLGVPLSIQTRTGIRTVLMPRSAIHFQSASVIHLSQWCWRTPLGAGPWTTSKSLCAGDRAFWKGFSAIHLSSTNQEPTQRRLNLNINNIEQHRTKVDTPLFAISVEFLLCQKLRRNVWGGVLGIIFCGGSSNGVGFTMQYLRKLMHSDSSQHGCSGTYNCLS